MKVIKTCAILPKEASKDKRQHAESKQYYNAHGLKCRIQLTLREI